MYLCKTLAVQCSLLTHMSGCVTAGLPREPGGPAFLLKERQTSVQETCSRHQRVDLTTSCCLGAQRDRHRRLQRRTRADKFYRCV